MEIRLKTVTNLPTPFGATNAGTVTVTYAAANPLPASGTDTITAQNHPDSNAHATTAYTYGGTVGFSQAPFTPVPPFRLCDTRPPGGAILPNQCNAAGQGPLNQTIRPIQTTGVTGSNVPGTGVTAVILNVTAITPTRNTYITVYPAGASKPATSSLNPVAGTVVANLIEVGVNGSGQIDVFNDVGTTGLLIDVEGYVSAPSTGVYHSLATPNRICDTRPVGGGALANQCNVGGTHPINGGTSVTFNVDANGDGVPTTASAVVFNLTAISPTINTVLTAYAGGGTVPNASNLNLSAHEVLPNRVVVPVGAGGVVSIRNSIGSVNVAVDIDGYFLNSGSGAQFTALPTPARVCNTIGGTPDTGGCVNGAVGAGHVLNIFVTGIDGIPALGSAHSPVALVVNVTAVNASTGTVVTVYPGPADAATPIASDLNLQGGQTVPNLVFVGVGSDGSINLFNDLGNVNLIVDVLGYYS